MTHFKIFIIIVVSFDITISEERKEKLDCSDFKESTIGSLFTTFSGFSPQENTKTNFFLVTKEHPKPVQIGPQNWTRLTRRSFDPSKKTYIITHGYLTHYEKPWVVEMREKLAQSGVNVILIDWKANAYFWNYVDSVQSTLIVKKHIFNFFEGMKTAVNKLFQHPTAVLWNHLHFIGHSLGAHLSGQVAHQLKQDNFYKVERLTGLDPAQPCFTKAPLSLRIDKDDADFVDIIHTQTGPNGKNDALGFKEPLGHIDFYVNGGVMQAACEDLVLEFDRVNCSHQIATDYFIESVSSSESNSCKFSSFRWDRTYDGALQALESKKKGKVCSECPEMGVNASKDKLTGNFIVFAGMEPPYCKLRKRDIPKIKESIERLRLTESSFADVFSFSTDALVNKVSTYLTKTITDK